MDFWICWLVIFQIFNFELYFPEIIQKRGFLIIQGVQNKLMNLPKFAFYQKWSLAMIPWPIKWQFCSHIETSQLICCANQLSGFHMRATLAINGLIENQVNAMQANAISWLKIYYRQTLIFADQENYSISLKTAIWLGHYNAKQLCKRTKQRWRNANITLMYNYKFL